jgi:hypothetical protein
VDGVRAGRGWRRRLAALALVAALAGGCGSGGGFRQAAHEAVEQMAAAVATAGYAAHLAADGIGFGPYLATLTGDADDAARSALGSFASVPPPESVDAALRERTDALLRQAASAVADAAAADPRQLAGRGAALDELGRRLDELEGRLG